MLWSSLLLRSPIGWRDYRGKYVALRARSKFCRVLALGLAEQMSEYLANKLNVHFCQNCLTRLISVRTVELEGQVSE